MTNLTINALFASYVARGGMLKQSSFKNKNALINAIDALPVPKQGLSKVDRARLRRLASAAGVSRPNGARWTPELIAQLSA